MLRGPSTRRHASDKPAVRAMATAAQQAVLGQSRALALLYHSTGSKIWSHWNNAVIGWPSTSSPGRYREPLLYHQHTAFCRNQSILESHFDMAFLCSGGLCFSFHPGST
ncbi:hypothetical protein CC2G_003336 [Coprinopsis cinerea AmutBmut pab1-1]|nr:hypothetical protein CC2G_003336 [Coprinopsis cinerea AmutBmut pab1-1]